MTTDRRVSADTAILGAAVADGDYFDLLDVSDPTDAVTGTNKKILASELALAVIALGSIATDAEVTAASGALFEYVGPWDVGTVYTAGQLVDRYDATFSDPESLGRLWPLFLATTSTTGDDPLDGAPWQLVTNPITMRSSIIPTTAHTGQPNDDALGLYAPTGTTLQFGGVDDSANPLGALFESDPFWYGWTIPNGGPVIALPADFGAFYVGGNASIYLKGPGDAGLYASNITAHWGGLGDGDVFMGGYGRRKYDGNGTNAGGAGSIYAGLDLGIQDGSTGDIDARVIMKHTDHASGTSYWGASATHRAGTAGHLYLTVDAGGARIDINADIGFYGATPVAKQTGVAVSAAGVHAALVNLGLIAA